MDQIITTPALRVKLTGVCNRSCNFCNEEGDMRTIGSMEPDYAFFECVNALTAELGIRKVMLTGGEPTIHPHLKEIVHGIEADEVSITTNGIRPFPVATWGGLREAGLGKVIVSIHDATPQAFVQLETRKHKVTWAARAIDSQHSNLATASQAGLKVRVNVVAYHSQWQVRQVLASLEELEKQYRFDIRLLNDLENIEASQQIIRGVCATLGATALNEERRAGSSNVTVQWQTKSGFRFSTKMAYPYFFAPICDGCQEKDGCHEGFYGIRLEKRGSDHWVRLCISKHTPDVLMPWRSFLASSAAQEFKSLCQAEQS